MTGSHDSGELTDKQHPEIWWGQKREGNELLIPRRQSVPQKSPCDGIILSMDYEREQLVSLHNKRQFSCTIQSLLLLKKKRVKLVV